ncbi:MAG: glutamine-hydrolyzing carbamoyl-phosphate synthase small subunit [Desulfovibrionaceae bacterium]
MLYNSVDKDAVLVLEDGTILQGKTTGITGTLHAELVFNTSIVGYQEMLTDMSYTGQAIVFTMPHIGAVGCNPNDWESNDVTVEFIVIRVLDEHPSNYRATLSLRSFMEQNKTPIFYGVDTRYLTILLREKGFLRATVQEIAIPFEDIDVTTKEKWIKECRMADIKWIQESEEKALSLWEEGDFSLEENRFSQSISEDMHIVVYDFGVKYNILRYLVGSNAKVTLVSQNASIEEVLALKPDGICISNGSGDPAKYEDILEKIRYFLEKEIPLLGICLGHQLIALALGAKTVKMKFGHHGANHPVQDTKTKEIYITSQNHCFVVEEESLPSAVEIQYRSLFDTSIQGFLGRSFITFQGHPEAGPGPNDAKKIFHKYKDLVMSFKKV